MPHDLKPPTRDDVAREIARPRNHVEEYQSAVRDCALARALLATHDIPALLRAIDRAESFGPIIDPTLYRAKKKAMEEDKALLRAALPLATFDGGRHGA